MRISYHPAGSDGALQHLLALDVHLIQDHGNFKDDNSIQIHFDWHWHGSQIYFMPNECYMQNEPALSSQPAK